MSDKLNPLLYPEIAAQEVLIELIRAGKIINSDSATFAFTALMDHYRAELKRVQREN
ncbi:hypothetical protein PO486_13725 [Atlantibacter hermannii]|uniref:hypothetical protein n=1 Tax=Atlantibacter hermannii TaxID=565 RepID=UPI002FF46CDF